MFRNMWYHQYGGDGGDGSDSSTSNEPWGGESDCGRAATGVPAAPVPCFELRRADERRIGSYRALLRDPKLRSGFINGFLGTIFNTYPDNGALFNIIKRAAWDSRNKDDVDIYEDIVAQLQSKGGGGPLGQAKMGWKQIKQLRAQKDELCRETGSILNRLNRLGTVVHDMCEANPHSPVY